jgi:hypothetical protein
MTAISYRCLVATLRPEPVSACSKLAGPSNRFPAALESLETYAPVLLHPHCSSSGSFQGAKDDPSRNTSISDVTELCDLQKGPQKYHPSRIKTPCPAPCQGLIIRAYPRKTSQAFAEPGGACIPVSWLGDVTNHDACTPTRAMGALPGRSPHGRSPSPSR